MMRYARSGPRSSLKRDGESSQKDVRFILIVSDLCSERIPDVLVTWDKSDSRSDCKIIESLNSALVFCRSHTLGERRNIIFQVIAKFIPIPSHPEAIVLPRIVETVGNERHACISHDCICIRPSEYADGRLSPDRFSIFQRQLRGHLLQTNIATDWRSQ